MVSLSVCVCVCACVCMCVCMCVCACVCVRGPQEVDVITGTGKLVTASATGPDCKLFAALPGSCGTLGIITRAVLRVRVPVPVCVHV